MTIIERDFAEWSEYVRGCVKGIVSDFTEPDDEVMPVFLINDAKKHFAVIPLHPFMPDTKFIGKVVLPSIVRRMHPVRAALVNATWYVQVAKDTEAGERAIRAAGRRELHLLPERKEAVTVTIAGRLAAEVWIVELLRHEDAPPTLGEWRNMADEDEGGVVEGLLVDPWIAAMRPEG